MPNVTFVTGNANKAMYFSELIGLEIEHHAADVREIQSLNLMEVAEHKAKEAYAQLQKPVIVEDVSLVINCMGRLPGPFIKWFIEEIGLEKICRLADPDPKRGAVASGMYAYYNGRDLKFFEASLKGTIIKHPKGDAGFGWNPIFVPEGANQTLGEMLDDSTFKSYYLRIKPIAELKKFLTRLENN